MLVLFEELYRWKMEAQSLLDHAAGVRRGLIDERAQDFVRMA